MNGAGAEAREIAIRARDLLSQIENRSADSMSLLMKTSRLARDLRTEKVEQWLEYEMRGYPAADALASQFMAYTGRWIDEPAGKAVIDSLPAIEERIACLKVWRDTLQLKELVEHNESGEVSPDAWERAMKACANELDRMTNQITRLVSVQANVLALIHAYIDHVFTERKIHLPDDHEERSSADVEELGKHIAYGPEPTNLAAEPAGAGDEDWSPYDPDQSGGVATLQEEEVSRSEADDEPVDVPIFDDAEEDIAAAGECSEETAPESRMGNPLAELRGLTDSEDYGEAPFDPSSEGALEAESDVDAIPEIEAGLRHGEEGATDSEEESDMSPMDAIDVALPEDEPETPEEVPAVEFIVGELDDSDETSESRDGDVSGDSNLEIADTEKDATGTVENPEEALGKLDDLLSELDMEDDAGETEAFRDVVDAPFGGEEALEQPTADDSENLGGGDVDTAEDEVTRDEGGGVDEPESDESAADTAMAEIDDIAKQEVQDFIKDLDPNLCGSLVSAELALGTGAPRGAAQSVRAARKLMDVFADKVFPPRNEPVVIQGFPVDVSADRPFNRLYAFAYENARDRNAEREDRMRLYRLYRALDPEVHESLEPDQARRYYEEAFARLHGLMQLLQTRV